MKKVVVKYSINFPNKIKGRIIYKNSRNESPINKPIRSSLNNNKKILNKNIDNENKNIVNNNNNDKETITTSTTTPITTPVKGTNELIKNINSDNSVSLSGGNNINKKLSHYEKNKLKFPNYFNNFKKYESNLVKDKKKLEFPFQKILSRNESAKSNNTYSFNFQNLTSTNNNSNNNINNYNYNKNNNIKNKTIKSPNQSRCLSPNNSNSSYKNMRRVASIHVNLGERFKIKNFQNINTINRNNEDTLLHSERLKKSKIIFK
jgi:hypothetical protein